MLIEARDGAITTRQGATEHPDAALSGPPQLVRGVLTGALGPNEAIEQGLALDGESPGADPSTAPGAKRVAERSTARSAHDRPDTRVASLG